MKKVILILAAAALASCQKQSMQENESEEIANTCAIVSNEAVPSVVQDAFLAKYPQNTASKWFNKDDRGFAAYFTENGSRKLAQFDNDGTFRTEIVNPPATEPSGTQSSCSTCPPPKEKCGKRPHRHPPLIPFMLKKKRHGNCTKEKSETAECQIALED
jgi:hypothetical protein